MALRGRAATPLTKGKLMKDGSGRFIVYGDPAATDLRGLPVGAVVVDVTTDTEYTNTGSVGAPEWSSGPAILRAEDFATDPASRWGQIDGTYLPTGGADGGGAFDLSAHDTQGNSMVLRDDTIFPGANTPTSSRAWSVRVRARWADFTAAGTGGGSDIVFSDPAYDSPARIFIGANGDATVITISVNLVTRSGSYDTADAATIDVTATLGDGEYHWIELVYADADDAATARAYLDDALLATVTDTSGPRAADTYPQGVQIDGPLDGTFVVDRVIVANGYQGA